MSFAVFARRRCAMRRLPAWAFACFAATLLPGTTVAAADVDSAIAAIATLRTDVRIDVRQSDGTEAILRRTLEPFEQSHFGIAAQSDERAARQGAPPLPQPPQQGDYPPGAFRLELVQIRGDWVRTSRFTREGEGAWQLADDQLDNPPGKPALGRSLSGATRPVQ